MTDNLKDWKLIKGCLTPQDTTLKDKYKRLVDIFAPVLYFDPDEIFFPVDLPTTVAVSSLYKVAGKPYEEKASLVQPKTPPNLSSSDLDSADTSYFTTVVGWTGVKKNMGSDPPKEITMPVPKITETHKKYSTGKIPAKLTMYATVCKPQYVPNFHFLEKFNPNIGLGVLKEGLLINYYFYFPAMFSSEHDREGDWSGISILFAEVPSPDTNTLVAQFNKKMGVWVFYYRKIGDYMVAYDVGIRSWSKVSKVKDKNGLETHPRVYISLGLHNCYYEPINTKISEIPSWTPLPDADKIEKGDYSPSPTGDTGGVLLGGDNFDDPWWVYALFPHMLLFDMCGIGCDFDSSGIAPSYHDKNDSVKSGGIGAIPDSAKNGKPPTSDSYPAQKPTSQAPISLKLNVVYVDTTDNIMRQIWKYQGSWGAAEVEKHNKSQWGCFKGFERPNLSSWFLWNLFWDVTFGSKGGTGYYNKTP